MSRTVASRRRGRARATDDVAAAAAGGVVAIVGRPNVGKSTLFNRLTGRHAIVDQSAGLTRDRLYGVAEWGGRRFVAVDTAGIDPALARAQRSVDQAVLVAGTQEQARLAVQEADLCLLLVDIRAGVTGLDDDVASILRAGGKPVILVGNKADSPNNPHFAHELWRLGLGDPVLVSALNGTDTGDLLDRVVAALPVRQPDGERATTAELRLAIIGRPNVGKSSLLNALVGKQRALVSPMPGTTRDSVDTVLERDGRLIRLVDTAGIRRRGVVSSAIEHYSLLRSLRAMERSDVAILVIDAGDGVVAQDRHVAGYAADAGKGLVVVANKWDLVDHEQRVDPAFLKDLHQAFGFVPGVPILTLSATQGRHVDRVLPAAQSVASARSTRIPTPALNTLLRAAFVEHPPRHQQGKQLKLLYAAQASTPAPTIVLFVNDPQLLHFSYSRYLENRIRAVFGFQGTRLRLVPRGRDGPGR